MKPNQAVSARIVVVDSSGEEFYSEPGSGATIPQESLLITNLYIEDRVLNWGYPESEEGGPYNYRIEYDRGIASWYEYEDELSVTWYYLSDLEIGVKYSFRVQAKNAYGYGQLSSEVTIILGDKPSQLDPPSLSLFAEHLIIDW